MALDWTIHYEKIGLEQTLALMEKKYPEGAILRIYDDGSGRIIKQGTFDAFNEKNVYFKFQEIDELIEHLEEN